MQLIIYPTDGGLAILVPSGALPLEEVARKDVPAGVPFKFIQEADLPDDSSTRDRWTADFSNPDGYGIGPEAWFAEQEAGQ